MMYNGIEVGALALGTALEGRKIEAIKLVRDAAGPGGYIGLKDAKDAVEAAMAQYEPSYATSTVGSLQRQLETSRLLRTQDADAAAADWRAQQHTIDDLRRVRDQLEARVRQLENAVADHFLGRTALPVLSSDPAAGIYDDDGDSPF
jgi:hypothetical protein